MAPAPIGCTTLFRCEQRVIARVGVERRIEEDKIDRLVFDVPAQYVKVVAAPLTFMIDGK